MQPPQSNQHERRDAATMSEFRYWVTERFPAVLRSLEMLQALQKRQDEGNNQFLLAPKTTRRRPTGACTSHESLLEANEAENAIDWIVADKGEPVDVAAPAEDQCEDDESEGETTLDATPVDRKTLREAQRDAWALLFEHARLVALAPEDEFVTQGRTRAGDVFFVLTGACDLTFRPDFLPVLLAEKERDRRRQQQQQCEPLDRSNDGATPSSPTRTLRSPRHENSERRRIERQLSLTCLSIEDVRRVEQAALHIRSLSPGDFFGHDAALFTFAHHLMTATSRGARQRNALGVTVPALMHVLRVPSAVLQEMRNITRDAIKRVHHHRSGQPASVSGRASCGTPRMVENAPKLDTPGPSSVFPYRFDSETVEFLRETFLFAPMSEARLRFLAAHMRSHRVRKHEFLFATGQRPAHALRVRGGANIGPAPRRSGRRQSPAWR